MYNEQEQYDEYDDPDFGQSVPEHRQVMPARHRPMQSHAYAPGGSNAYARPMRPMRPARAPSSGGSTRRSRGQDTRWSLWIVLVTFMFGAAVGGLCAREALRQQPLQSCGN